MSLLLSSLGWLHFSINECLLTRAQSTSINVLLDKMLLKSKCNITHRHHIIENLLKHYLYL